MSNEHANGQRKAVGAGLAIGVAIGASLGVALGNVAAG